MKWYLLAYLMAAAPALADYARGTVSLGGYLLDSKDAVDHGTLYQSDRVDFSGRRGDVDFLAAYQYSDLADKRPNSYRTDHRLSLARVAYDPASGPVALYAGRDFLPLAERAAFVDGGSVLYRGGGALSLQAFGGYLVPDVYTPDLARFDRQGRAGGAILRYTPFAATSLYLDGAKLGEDNAFSTALRIRQGIGPVTASGFALYHADTSALQAWALGLEGGLRARDAWALRAGAEGDKVDSTPAYAYFIDRRHRYAYASYLLFLDARLQVAAEGGALLYSDVTGYTGALTGYWYGAFLRLGRGWEDDVGYWQATAGWSGRVWRRLGADAGAGWSAYDLSARSTDRGLRAKFVRVGPSAELAPGLELRAAYEFLVNPVYREDHRFSAGLRYGFFRSGGR